MNHKNRVINQLTHAILLCTPTAESYEVSIAELMGVANAAAKQLAKAIAEQFVFEAYPRLSKTYLSNWLGESALFDSLYQSSSKIIRVWPIEHNALTRRAQTLTEQYKWDVPQINSIAHLADWCKVSDNDLIWLSGQYRRRSDQQQRCNHYHLTWLEKGSRPRLLEIPKPRLAQLQRQILATLIGKVPVHPAACGFVKGRSIMDFVRPHVARKRIIKFDLTHYFWSISSGRVYRLLHNLGYPADVCRVLTQLCCHRIIDTGVLKGYCEPQVRQRLQHDHLPQGAPSSPGLANLCTFGLDVRLSALAAQLGYQYSRYADDFAFSTDDIDMQKQRSLIRNVSAITKNEGFQINRQKSRIMTQANAQRLTGLVINESIGVGRKHQKAFEAELYNCVKFGPGSQNKTGLSHYREYLQGRLDYIIHISPQKAHKLAALFDSIHWESDSE